jgi:hypothetical protein
MLQVLRRCRDCGLEANSIEDLRLFKTDKKSLFGKENLCKKCAHIKKNRYCAEHRAEVRVKNNDYAKQRYANDPLFRMRVIENARKHPEKNRIAVSNFRKRHPENTKAHNAVRSIPLGKICEECDSSEKLTKHHPDYTKPREFKTLCKKHHDGKPKRRRS